MKVHVSEQFNSSPTAPQGWVELPMPAPELREALESLGLGAGHTLQTLVSERLRMTFGWTHTLDGASIEDLNILAAAMEECEYGIDVVSKVMDAQIYDEPDSVIGLCNWIFQANEIPYYSYDIPEDLFANDSPELKFGHYLAESNGVTAALEEMGVQQYFDYELYGKGCSQFLELCDEGYIDTTQDMPSEDRMTRDDLIERLSCSWNLMPYLSEEGLGNLAYRELKIADFEAGGRIYHLVHKSDLSQPAVGSVADVGSSHADPMTEEDWALLGQAIAWGEAVKVPTPSISRGGR